VLSAACVVHCAVTPVVMAMLPAAASVLGGAHPVLLVAVMGVAVWAFVPGFKRHGRVEVLLGRRARSQWRNQQRLGGDFFDRFSGR